MIDNGCTLSSSRECQVKHWPDHKLQCGVSSSSDTSESLVSRKFRLDDGSIFGELDSSTLVPGKNFVRFSGLFHKISSIKISL